jgi:hypothetical protein
VQQKEIDHILASVKAPIEHPLFYPRIFALAAKRRRVERKTTADAVSHLVTEEYEELSRRLDRSQLQESCSVRNVLRTRKLAQLLIDDKGEINLTALPIIISYFKEHLYSLGPNRQYDGKRQEHILKVLKLLHTRKDLVLLIKKFTRPLLNKWAEELIRHTLQLSPSAVITDAHTRQAVLSAWLCYLRQNVGSCFATAPAEIVHDEQPEQFLQDLLDLIATSQLKRTFGGVENSVPLSTSWGSGDLKKPLLIRISSKGIVPEIWYAPGLIAAFESIGFLKPEDRIKQKVQQIEGWIKPLIQQRGYSQSFCVMTTEEMIRIILLQNLGITEKQVKEYDNRPRGIVHAQLLVQNSQKGKNIGGIGERCAHFLYLFEVAKNVFKSLADNALLKAWEFTLASFSDIKYEFARWNFYASLGLGTHEPGGIGQCIYQTIQQRLDQANRKVQDIQYEYEIVYTQVKTLESRMRHASTEKELQWLKMDYQNRANEFYFLEEQRNEAQNHATALVNLYDTLHKLYVDLFKDYFQEVYDADMQEVTTGRFDDSPAGFRLLYKHGRSNTSQWTRIKNQHDFIDALVAFFVATEPQIAHVLEQKKIEKDLSDVVTTIINHIKTNEFLESAFHRMAIAHHAPVIKDPLEHLDQIEKKPWVYTSGGTMNTLISCYYRIEDKPKEVEKWVENEVELLVYLADTMKQIPPSFLEPYLKDQRHSMLIQSPTHAFLLKPTIAPFRETWSNDEFTYTFIRDHFIRPAELFIERLMLNDEMLQFLIQLLAEKIPENFLPRFKATFGQMSGPLNPIFFREYLVDRLDHDRGLRYGSHAIIASEEIDSFLYSSLPLFPIHELKNHLDHLLNLLPGLTSEKINQILQLFDQIPLSRGEHPYLRSQQLQEICKALLCLSEVSTTTSFDYHLHISLAAQKLGFALPMPLIFADTNWVKDMFGFVVNPGTGKLELWRLDYTGSTGYPMSSWKQWVDGSRSDLKWSIYVKPFQYGQN